MLKGSGYRNPGRVFINQCGLPKRASNLPAYVERYADFLLEAVDYSGLSPVDVRAICDHFGITHSDSELPERTEGTSDGQLGMILVNQDRPEVRRRFTRGHELVELLFSALMESPVSDEVWHHLTGNHKESLCNQGAAFILMPNRLVSNHLQQFEVTIESAYHLAEKFQTSLLASMIRMVRESRDRHALIFCKYALKPKELRTSGNSAQLSLGDAFFSPPRKKLRVQWVRRSPQLEAFLPKHKSIQDNSIVHKSISTREALKGMEQFDLESFCEECFIETLPTILGGEEGVLALIRVLS